MRYGQPVLNLILSRFPVTLQLAVMSVVIALLLGIPIGILSAVKHNSVIDLIGRVLALLGLAIPSFLLGTVLIFRAVGLFSDSAQFRRLRFAGGRPAA